MKVTFLGTGTSQGVPVIACDCPVCTSADPRDARLRSSVMVETQGKTFVVDAGPDFRQQMLRARVQHLDALLLTHGHKDHVAGLDDVRAFNFRQRRAMDVYGDERSLNQLRREFAYIFDGSDYPGIPKVELHQLPDPAHRFDVQGVAIQTIPVLHYRLPVTNFRFGDFAYVTDASYIPEATRPHLQGLDVLVLNALRKEKHISHFNLEEALEMIAELKPRRAYLTHISHLMGLHAEVEQELPHNVHIAWDGLTLDLPDA